MNEELRCFFSKTLQSWTQRGRFRMSRSSLRTVPSEFKRWTHWGNSLGAIFLAGEKFGHVISGVTMYKYEEAVRNLFRII